MHGDNGETITKKNFNVAPFGVLKGASLLFQPSFELLAVHVKGCKQICI
jgi:hypothetical protein